MKKNYLMVFTLLFFLAVMLFAGDQIEKRKVSAYKSLRSEEDYPLQKQEELNEEVKRVGVLMPNRSSERWISDGINMKAKLEAIGYEVELQFADDDIDLQIKQIENMLVHKVDCLVIASIDSEALVDVLQQAKGNGVFIIAYDRLLMDTNAVSYYATFDNKAIGTMIGSYIEEKMKLPEAEAQKKSYTIEFFMGSPDDNNALYLYNGLMEVLGPYLESGVLRCKSGNISFEDTCILRWSGETAKLMCLDYLNQYYQDEPLDIACSAFDGFSYGIKKAFLSENYSKNDQWPFITGQDAELPAIKDIVDGYQDMTIYKDTRKLAEKCTMMVQAVLEGTLPELNDMQQYHNGKKIVPSYLCEPIIIDQENYERILVDGGYYTKVQIMNE